MVHRGTYSFFLLLYNIEISLDYLIIRFDFSLTKRIASSKQGIHSHSSEASEEENCQKNYGCQTHHSESGNVEETRECSVS